MEWKRIKTKKRRRGEKKKIYGVVRCVKMKGGGAVKKYTSGIHICERLREEPELEIQQEMDGNEKREMEGAKTMTHT